MSTKFSVAIKSDGYKNLINDTLGDKEVARQFVANISTVVANNPMLQNCDAGSIISAGLMASSLKLPLSPTLGFAYMIPYGNKAQFQMGYKGLIQLAMRSGQVKDIDCVEVHEGEYKGKDNHGQAKIEFDDQYSDKPIVGYMAYLVLTNGFEKTLYWTKEQCEKHGHKYSKSYNKLWGDPEMFGAMAKKTVLKMLISKYAPMDTELSKAVQADQAVIKDDGTFDYVDNQQNDEPTKREAVKAPEFKQEGFTEALAEEPKEDQKDNELF